MIKTTKYNLGGNILAPSGTHSLTDLLFKGEDVRTLESQVPARKLEFVSNMYKKKLAINKLMYIINL